MGDIPKLDYLAKARDAAAVATNGGLGWAKGDALAAVQAYATLALAEALTAIAGAKQAVLGEVDTFDVDEPIPFRPLPPADVATGGYL